MGKVLVTRYEVTRHYGGPEEGGWWYDRREAKEIVLEIAGGLPNIDEVGVLTESGYPVAPVVRSLNRIAARQRREDRRPQGRFSVAGGSDTVFMSESFHGEHDDIDEPHPHYC